MSNYMWHCEYKTQMYVNFGWILKNIKKKNKFDI